MVDAKMWYEYNFELGENYAHFINIFASLPLLGKIFIIFEILLTRYLQL